MDSQSRSPQKAAFTPLPYTLHGKYTSIALAWTFILFPPVILNLGLFYGLWYGTTLSPSIILAIPNAVFGVQTAINVFFRMRKLCSKSRKHLPINSPRAALDPFQWGYFLGIVLVTVEEVVGLSIKHGPLIRLVSMPASTLMYEMAVLGIITLVVQSMNIRVPFRIGSFPAGSTMRPLIYYLIEDIVAVEGGGCTEYRTALNERYESSSMFRNMLWVLTWVWTIGYFLVAGGVTAVVFTVKAEVAYGVGWAVPVLFSAVLAMGTIVYVKRCLSLEKRVVSKTFV